MKISARQLIDSIVDRLGEMQYVMTFDPTSGRFIPSVGGTLKVTETDRKKALRLLNELEKHRILYETLHYEQVDLSVQSVTRIRDYISTDIIGYKRQSRLVAFCRELIEACQEFLNLTQMLEARSGSYYTLSKNDWRIFRAAIKRLRQVFAKWILQIVADYDIEIDESLARIVPGSPRYNPVLLENDMSEFRA